MTEATADTAPPGAPIKPPFTRASAVAKVRLAEDAWNTRDPQRVALAYTEDSLWRNRAEFLRGRAAIREFLQRKWSRELDYRRLASINDVPIAAAERKYHWSAPGPRPKDHPGLSDLGL